MACNLRIWTAIVVVWVVFAARLHAAEIHLQSLRMQSPSSGEVHMEQLLPHEIAGVEAEHVALTGPLPDVQSTSTDAPQKYIVRKIPESKLDSTTLTAPDLSRFTMDSIRDMAPVERDGVASIGVASEFELLEESFRGDRGLDLRRRQGVDEPRVIFIDSGSVTLNQVVSQLDDAEIVEERDGVVTVRLPLVVKPGGVLIIDGKSTSKLQLSTARGAFVANAGRLFVIDAVVTSWSEDALQPSTFVAKEQFRPFISSYIRSKTYVAGCMIQHLGFAAPTAYGFSLSSHPERNRGDPHADWPTGTIVGNEFRGMYYGFYSYEARDVALVDNRYIDSIVYGIDPHDRSTRLIIARNTSRGTIERHGIIGSRGISQSCIFENVAYDNAGSGIMLDRQCKRNLISDNKVFQNGQGIAVYESPDNVISDNLIAFNRRSGIRIRNSVDIRILRNTVVGNEDYALEVYAKQLDDHEKRVSRGDTYVAKVGVSFLDNVVRGNRGLAKATNLGLLRLSNIRQDVDVSAIAAELEIEDGEVESGDDAAFGQALQPLALELRRIIDNSSLILEVTEADP